jgi:hypothetical protein
VATMGVLIRLSCKRNVALRYPSSSMTTSNEKPDIRLRVMLAPGIPLGPGKAQLLQGIKETGSISAAGRRSYNSTNHFDAAMVEATKGSLPRSDQRR